MIQDAMTLDNIRYYESLKRKAYNLGIRLEVLGDPKLFNIMAVGLEPIKVDSLAKLERVLLGYAQVVKS